jgi:hypothetical protein
MVHADEASPRRSATILAPPCANTSMRPSSVGTPVISSIARSTASASCETASAAASAGDSGVRSAQSMDRE